MAAISDAPVLQHVRTDSSFILDENASDHDKEVGSPKLNIDIAKHDNSGDVYEEVREINLDGSGKERPIGELCAGSSN
jgi:hypothetical protein